jgi:hypothetical protein
MINRHLLLSQVSPLPLRGRGQGEEVSQRDNAINRGTVAHGCVGPTRRFAGSVQVEEPPHPNPLPRKGRGESSDAVGEETC